MLSAVGNNYAERAAFIKEQLPDPSQALVGQYVIFLGEVVARINSNGNWDKRFKSFGLYSKLNQMDSFSVEPNLPFIDGRLSFLHERKYEEIWPIKQEWVDQVRKDPLNEDLQRRAKLDLFLKMCEVDDRESLGNADYLEALYQQEAEQEVDALLRSVKYEPPLAVSKEIRFWAEYAKDLGQLAVDIELESKRLARQAQGAHLAYARERLGGVSVLGLVRCVRYALAKRFSQSECLANKKVVKEALFSAYYQGFLGVGECDFVVKSLNPYGLGRLYRGHSFMILPAARDVVRSLARDYERMRSTVSPVERWEQLCNLAGSEAALIKAASELRKLRGDEYVMQ